MLSQTFLKCLEEKKSVLLSLIRTLNVILEFVFRSSLARQRMTLERVAFSHSFATAQWKFICQKTLWNHISRVDTVEVSMRPGRARPEASSRRAKNELDPGRTSDRRSFLIERIRIQWRVAVSKTAVGWTPGTGWFRTSEKKPAAQTREWGGHFLYSTAGWRARTHARLSSRRFSSYQVVDSGSGKFLELREEAGRRARRLGRSVESLYLYITSYGVVVVVVVIILSCVT